MVRITAVLTRALMNSSGTPRQAVQSGCRFLTEGETSHTRLNACVCMCLCMYVCV